MSLGASLQLTAVIAVLGVARVIAADGAEPPAAARIQTEEDRAFRIAIEPFTAASDAQDIHGTVDFPPLRKTMEKFWARFPDSQRSVSLASKYMAMFEHDHPGAAIAEWTAFVASPSPLVAELARGKLRFVELAKQPFALKFTAIDGRVVDIVALRGKVVLLDFWATWCTPCIAELPNLMQVYARYHDRGFEVIGISLDGAEDRQRLVEFVAREKLPWPQHFDGKIWQNEFARQYAINAAPTVFLLNREGRLAVINPERKQLASEIERLLGR